MKPKTPSLPSGWPLGVALGLLALSVTGIPAQQAPVPNTITPDQAAFFETKIRPLFLANCVSCHGKDQPAAGLRLDTHEGLTKGSDSGSVIVSGEPDKSLLIQAVRQTGAVKMPVGKKLAPAQIADLEAWVKMGAPWPDSASKSTRPQDAPLWSLQPVRREKAPKVKNAAWVRNPIDAFVLAKLETNRQSPAAPADRRTLIRRVTYDLIGLPPTPAEVATFLADKSPNAYDKVVDRLLASPHYGERWARHWLDVARYADTKGYVFNEDRTYANAYTYRDWVIDAFNRDLPYDQFIEQQLAADRLPAVANGDDKRPLAALGFLTLGRRFLNSRPDIIDDRIDVTMRGFQGFTVACARCHDHKFDPIPTQDYYSLYAVFDSSDEVTAPISEKAIRDPWIQYNARVEAMQGELNNTLATQTKRLRDLDKKPEGVSRDIHETLKGIREGDLPQGAAVNAIVEGFEPPARQRWDALQKDLADARQHAPATPALAMAMCDSPNPHDGVVFRRGNPGNPGSEAPRRFLAALFKPGVERPHWDKDSGRLELAQAIASKENPLTARVFVNRVWQDHFGAGLVRTPSDFGHQGEHPSHPELLDYLATTFMDSGWSIKKLHRLIVTSATYRQSSDVPQAVISHDPENRLLGRMNRRRLDMEEMRDAMVAAAGRIDLKQVGGRSVDLWAAPFTPCRAVYGFVERQNLPGIFRTFDFASPDSTSARRFFTTVPQQALFFMNSPFAVEQAQSLVQREEIKSSTDDAQRVRRLYQILFDRLPDADETAFGLAYLKHGAVAAATPDWQYGYGEYDESSRKTRTFTPFAHFTNEGYHAAPGFPDPNFGYALLNGGGGHPGRDAAHAVIRRWVAPITGTIDIEGTLSHNQDAGDGIRARIVSSRKGLLGEWTIRHRSVDTRVKLVSVTKGETLDFIVDPLTNDNSDGFGWNPTLRTNDGKGSWSAGSGFGPPPPAPPSRLALYAQALMMTNEFLFID